MDRPISRKRVFFGTLRITARGQKVSVDDVLPQINVVQNGYVSIVAYQNKGYALLAMD